MTSAVLSPHTLGDKERLSPWLPWVYLVFYQIIFFYIFSKNKIKQRTNIWKYTRPQRLCVCMSMNDCKKYFLFFKKCAWQLILKHLLFLIVYPYGIYWQKPRENRIDKKKGGKKKKHLVIDVTVMMIPNPREALAHLLSLIFTATNMYTEII